MDHLPLLIGALLVLITGFLIITKVAKVLVKIVSLIATLAVLIFLFYDKLPL